MTTGHPSEPRNRRASIYAEVRRRHPTLPTVRLPKKVLVPLTHVLEDEIRHRSGAALLFGGFQTDVFLASSRRRWQRLATTAHSAVVFAESPDDLDDALFEVPLEPDSLMRMEWAVVCDDARFSTLLTAWELPGQTGTADPERVFETLWTLDPVAVRDAAMLCAFLVEQVDPARAARIRAAMSRTPGAETDVREAGHVFTTILAAIVPEVV